ncbi:hypothetical protein B5M43_003840 [Microbacterium sp. MEC084]|uniref:ABC transporter substrate-binding protein n=1 Tax=Microbacterium sp. MEC084 TaxID=1963027 RepID=UPI00106FD883|nr:ABC transporter substrate-binding protein [Microbacterium sp. MEC084]MCD1267981.1 hypothetical protein [Microbacterium sp. MEC084]
MTAHRAVAAPLALALAAGLAACAPAQPATVVPGSEIVVGWTGELTGVNAQAITHATPGDLDVAELTRAGFGDLIDGELVPDEGFGSVTIVDDDPFTVRYDLAEPSWSDGIPLDAADLLLGWAAASGFFAPESFDPEAHRDAEGVYRPVPGVPWFDVVPSGLRRSAAPPAVDEFARAIEVTFEEPVVDWQHALAVSVPAHVAGRLAFGLDDDMEAKQAVVAAVRDGDADALERLADVWNEGFALDPSGELPPHLLLSSGPFRVQQVEQDEAGQSVVLVPNESYRGAPTPQFARVRLVPPGDDPVAAIGEQLDVVQVAPTSENRAPIRELERTDFAVDAQHDGTVWALMLNPGGIFTQHAVRTAFLHGVPRGDLVERGAGEWASVYPPSTSMVTAPGSRAYDIANEDSGFAQTLGEPAGQPEEERQAVGVAPGTRVCVLYDRRSAFASGAFAALRDAGAEAGWGIADCGSDDYAAALADRDWDAAIARVPIPQTPAEIAAQWGAEGAASVTRHADPERDELIARLARTADVYEARDVRAAIEATIVRAAVALPLAANPRITIADRDVTGVAGRSGPVAPLTHDSVQWAPAP